MDINQPACAIQVKDRHCRLLMLTGSRCRKGSKVFLDDTMTFRKDWHGSTGKVSPRGPSPPNSVILP